MTKAATQLSKEILLFSSSAYIVANTKGSVLEMEHPFKEVVVSSPLAEGEGIHARLLSKLKKYDGGFSVGKIQTLLNEFCPEEGTIRIFAAFPRGKHKLKITVANGDIVHFSCCVLSRCGEYRELVEIKDHNKGLSVENCQNLLTYILNGSASDLVRKQAQLGFEFRCLAESKPMENFGVNTKCDPEKGRLLCFNSASLGSVLELSKEFSRLPECLFSNEPIGRAFLKFLEEKLSQKAA